MFLCKSTIDRYAATFSGMHREVKEMLAGSTAILLFGAALIQWPSFGLFVDQHLASHLSAVWHSIPRAF